MGASGDLWGVSGLEKRYVTTQLIDWWINGLIDKWMDQEILFCKFINCINIELEMFPFVQKVKRVGMKVFKN